MRQTNIDLKNKQTKQNNYCLKLGNTQTQQNKTDVNYNFSGENSNSNSITLFYKDCSLGSVKNLSNN